MGRGTLGPWKLGWPGGERGTPPGLRNAIDAIASGRVAEVLSLVKDVLSVTGPRTP